MKHQKIYRKMCPRCKGDVTVENYRDTGDELYCISCGERRAFNKINLLLNVRRNHFKNLVA